MEIFPTQFIKIKGIFLNKAVFQDSTEEKRKLSNTGKEGWIKKVS